jgi:hypothetical protein
MANTRPQLSLEYTISDGYLARTARDVKKGDEVFIDYGWRKYNTCKFVFSHAFLPPEDWVVYDYVSTKLSDLAFPPAVLARVEPGYASVKLYARDWRQLLRYARLLVSGPTEWALQAFSLPRTPICKENEVRALLTARELLRGLHRSPDVALAGGGASAAVRGLVEAEQLVLKQVKEGIIRMATQLEAGHGDGSRRRRRQKALQPCADMPRL